MSQETINTLIGILTPVALGFLVWLSNTFRQYLNVKIAAVQHDELQKWIQRLVMSAEQQFKDFGSSQDKLDYVTEQARLYAQSLGLTLSREQVRALIESAVRAMTVQEAATVTLTSGTTAGTTTTTEASITTTPEVGTTPNA